MKRFFIYRGLRIRPWLIHVRRIFYGLLFLPFLITIVYVGYMNQERYIALDYIWIGGTTALFLVGLCLVKLLQLYLEERFLSCKKIQRLWVFTRYLLDYKYYYEKKTSDGKSKVRFPKIYLKQGRYDLEVYLEMQGNKFQDKFKNIAGELETTFFMDYIEKTYEEKYIIYKLSYSAFLNRIHAKDVEYVEGRGIQLMKGFFWDFVNDPHLLIAGGTNGGKTVFIRSLLVAILKIGTATVIDPKRADFVTMAELDVLKNRVYYELEESVAALENEVVIMNNRYDHMRAQYKERGYREMGDWRDYDLAPHFSIMDELNAFMSALGAYGRLRERADNALLQIILKGRMAGCYQIMAGQKPTNEDLPTKLRASMMMRISVGRLDSGGYEIMFGHENANKEFRYIKYLGGKRVYGRGYAAVNGEVAREFYAPLITPGFSFLDIFETYERRENSFNPREAEVAPQVYTREETVAVLNELLETNSVTDYMVRKLYEAMTEKGYPFSMVDDKKAIFYSDIEFMKQAISMKNTSPLGYEEIVESLMVLEEE
ncbi:cell division protein FtsK [Streptococcus suis]|uniref:FtsK/SpoIIIE domain-containing protein n=1 Tax=Streptococcus suis TaxID=1307 RepID=UPI001ABE4FDA|nr:FtsK/SpoIIIE domain-containing protein [Streptococcus suis]MBO4108665.1 cell division protein FtsK [Streptococcus suis]